MIRFFLALGREVADDWRERVRQARAVATWPIAVRQPYNWPLWALSLRVARRALRGEDVKPLIKMRNAVLNVAREAALGRMPQFRPPATPRRTIKRGEAP